MGAEGFRAKVKPRTMWRRTVLKERSKEGWKSWEEARKLVGKDLDGKASVGLIFEMIFYLTFTDPYAVQSLVVWMVSDVDNCFHNNQSFLGL